MRAIRQAFGGLLLASQLAGVAGAAPSVDDFRYHLQEADCDFLEDGRAIDLWVFDIKFPLAIGFNFYGHEGEGVSFRKGYALTPLEYMELHPGVSAADAVRELSAQQALVTYYAVENDEDLSRSEYSKFASFEWQGLSLLYRSSVGGRQIQSTVHQVIIRKDGDLERLRITATNPKQIANIIACAQAIE